MREHPMGREPSKKIFLPSSRQARPSSPVHLRRRGMPACPVIRNNAAPFLFRTIPIPSVHDAGWHVRVYEASRTVKKKVPRRLRESTHELWSTAASGYEQWQLINYINLYNNPTSVRPLQRHLIFSPSPRQRNLPEVGKNGNHQERDSAITSYASKDVRAPPEGLSKHKKKPSRNLRRALLNP